MKRVCVTGAGGFIGHHLVNRLKSEGLWVRGVDIKDPEYAPTRADEFDIVDLTFASNAKVALARVDTVFHLAANMGGIGFITAKHAEVARDNILIDANVFHAASHWKVDRIVYSSSACAYPVHLQTDISTMQARPLREQEAYPANPERGYGWEKLFAEQLLDYYREDHGLSGIAVRFHNVYGPLGTYDGGREKAPAALCRKIAFANDGGEIDVWGDGKQVRSYMYIDDCVEGLWRLAHSARVAPINLGTDHAVSVDGLINTISTIAGKQVRSRYDLAAPQGVRARNSDNGELRRVLGWEPQITLYEGLEKTYRWIDARVATRRAAIGGGQ